MHVKKGEKGKKETSWVKRGNLPPEQDQTGGGQEED